MNLLRGALLIAVLIFADQTVAEAKPFALRVRAPLLRMGSYDLGFNFSPDGRNNLQINTQVRLHRKNPLVAEGEIITAGSIAEMLIKPGLTAEERNELRTYSGLDDRALQSLQASLAQNSDVTLSELERKAEQILDGLEVPHYQRPRPQAIARHPASGDDSQVLDFSTEQ